MKNRVLTVFLAMVLVIVMAAPSMARFDEAEAFREAFGEIQLPEAMKCGPVYWDATAFSTTSEVLLTVWWDDGVGSSIVLKGVTGETMAAPFEVKMKSYYRMPKAKKTLLNYLILEVSGSDTLYLFNGQGQLLEFPESEPTKDYYLNGYPALFQ